MGIAGPSRGHHRPTGMTSWSGCGLPDQTGQQRRVGAADLGADPRATLMVGDNPIRGCGATACGLRTYILPAEHRTGDRGLADTLRLVGSR